jgi:hypothetical protein
MISLLGAGKGQTDLDRRDTWERLQDRYAGVADTPDAAASLPNVVDMGPTGTVEDVFVFDDDQGDLQLVSEVQLRSLGTMV